MFELLVAVGLLFAAYWCYRYGIRRGSRDGFSAGRRKARDRRR